MNSFHLFNAFELVRPSHKKVEIGEIEPSEILERGLPVAVERPSNRKVYFPFLLDVEEKSMTL